MKKILILSSDSFFAGKLLQQLEQWGYSVTTLSDHSKAYQKLEQVSYSLIIIDSLFISDPLEIIEYISSESFNTRIFVLYGERESKYFIKAFESGADDCVDKTADFHEIVLRIIRLFKFSKCQISESLKIKALELFPESGILLIDGKKKLIRRRESQILDCLIRYKNNVVTRNTLIKTVWGVTEIPTFTTVDVYIRRIRLLLPNPKIITTVRGFGYMIKD